MIICIDLICKAWRKNFLSKRPSFGYSMICRSNATFSLLKNFNSFVIPQNWFRSNSHSTAMSRFPEPTVATKTATFGMGCFWGSEARFGVEPGVIRTKVGYIGGKAPSVSYKNIGDHTEGAQMEFDPNVITYRVSFVLFATWSNLVFFFSLANAQYILERARW